MKPVQITIQPTSVALFVAALGLLAASAQSPTQIQPSRIDGQMSKIQTLTDEQADILSQMSIVQLDDGLGGLMKTIRFTGVNVQVVNGMGATESTNGSGNLIVGYQELGNGIDPDDRTGSHYLIVGRRNNYTSYGGVLVGEQNIGQGRYGSIYGGRRNRASGPWSTILGGGQNHASGQEAIVVGGVYNFSAGQSSVVVGGGGNKAVSPGGGGTANGAVVLGGNNNTARAQNSVIVGGQNNDTTANNSAILAGTNNECFGDSQGGGSYCAIVGGDGNFTSNVDAATVSGGLNRSALGANDWVGGSLFEDN